MSTAFDLESLNFAGANVVKALKTAFGEITNHPAVYAHAKSGQTSLSTGMATVSEINTR